MDYSKAFDRVLHGKLFDKMLRKGFSPIFLRLLMFIYINQTVNVRWKDKVSDRFRMTNAVRQGAVSSAILYCFYCEELFQELKKRKSGCWIGNLYLGILGYSDDNFILAPSIGALRDMIWTCESFAKKHNLQFSTDPNPEKCKTKLIAFSKSSNYKPNANVYLCDNILPWVVNVKHVGNQITSIVDGMQKDIQIKEAMYIENVNSLQQELKFAHPKTLWKLNMVYNFHFSGCELWDFNSKSFGKFMSTIQRSFKIMFDLPYDTHRYFYEAVTATKHPSIIIRTRFVNFLKMINQSNKVAPKLLLQHVQSDVRSVTGSNLRSLFLEYDTMDLSDVEPQLKSCTLIPVPEVEKWRIGVLLDAIDNLNDICSIENFDKAMTIDIINYVCNS